MRVRGGVRHKYYQESLELPKGQIMNGVNMEGVAARGQ